MDKRNNVGTYLDNRGTRLRIKGILRCDDRRKKQKTKTLSKKYTTNNY